MARSGVMKNTLGGAPPRPRRARRGTGFENTRAGAGEGGSYRGNLARSLPIGAARHGGTGSSLAENGRRKTMQHGGHIPPPVFDYKNTIFLPP